MLRCSMLYIWALFRAISEIIHLLCLSSVCLFFYRPTLCVIAELAVSRWCPVHLARSRIVSKLLKTSSIFFYWSGSPIILLFEPIRPYTSTRGTRKRGPEINVGSEKFVSFGQYLAVSWKRYETGSWLLWNVNRKS